MIQAVKDEESDKHHGVGKQGVSTVWISHRLLSYEEKVDKAFFNHMEESWTILTSIILIFAGRAKQQGTKHSGEVQRLFFFSAGTPPSRLLGLGQTKEN